MRWGCSGCLWVKVVGVIVEWSRGERKAKGLGLEVTTF